MNAYVLSLYLERKALLKKLHTNVNPTDFKRFKHVTACLKDAVGIEG